MYIGSDNNNILWRVRDVKSIHSLNTREWSNLISVKFSHYLYTVIVKHGSIRPHVMISLTLYSTHLVTFKRFMVKIL